MLEKKTPQKRIIPREKNDMREKIVAAGKQIALNDAVSDIFITVQTGKIVDDLADFRKFIDLLYEAGAEKMFAEREKAIVELWKHMHGVE